MTWSAASASTTACGSRAGGNLRRRCDGSGGVASHWLDDHGRLDSDFFGLPAGKEMEIWSCDYDWCGEHRISHAQQSLLVGRPVAHQRKELLGQGIARHRPEPSPGAAGKQNGDDWRRHWR